MASEDNHSDVHGRHFSVSSRKACSIRCVHKDLGHNDLVYGSNYHHGSRFCNVVVISSDGSYNCAVCRKYFWGEEPLSELCVRLCALSCKHVEHYG